MEMVEEAIVSTGTSIADLIIETPGTCGGRPRIAGRRITVEDIAVWHERMGLEADVICSEYGLTLGQVHAALAHYFENREAIDRSIRDGNAMVESMRLNNVSPLQGKLERSRSA